MKISLAERDFVVYDTEHQASCATVVLLDMSGSMARYGKFYHAKKVALALLGLVRGRYTEDSLRVMGFYTYASALSALPDESASSPSVPACTSGSFARDTTISPPSFLNTSATT